MDSGEREAFARRLRRLRMAAGLTQQELAEHAGVSVRAISDLEREINERPRRDTAGMLADGLRLTGAEREAFLAAAQPRPRHSPTPGSARYPRLPESTGPLLGRERELRAIADALLSQDLRLLTLTGPGGVGKTRLAIEVAHQVVDRFDDGVLFLRLDGLNDPTLVLPTLAGALLLRETGGELSLPERVAAHLRQREMLIVLDNLEHLLPAVPDLMMLLSRAPRSRFLVTSRESLRVEAERVFTVAPLARPDSAAGHPAERISDASGFPAVELFVHRALARRPDLPVDPETAAGRENLAAIAEICHRLDGLPLAIELAAAQVQVFSPAVIQALLKNAGLPLLVGGGRDQPARLQTMDAAIAWGYTLLPAEEQALFRALSVFAGGFTLSAAAAVAGSSGREATEPLDPRRLLDGLDPILIASISSLARKNLLFEEAAAETGAAPRFRMLEPIRLFALDRLCQAGEEPLTRLHHAIFFARLAEALDDLTLGPDPEIWLHQQIADLDNFRAALDWALGAGEHDLFVRIACAVAQLWELRGLLSEARQRVTQAMAVDGASTPENRWFLRFWAGTFAFDAGDFEEVARFGQELQEIARAHGDSVGIGVGFILLSRAIGARAERREEAAELARHAVDTLEPLGFDEWTGGAWGRLGIELHRLGRLEEARVCHLRSLEVRRRKGCAGCVAYSLTSLGAVSLDLGDPVAALDAYRESLALTVKQENQTLMLAVLLGLADVAWRCGEGAEPERAALLFFGAAEALRKRHGLGRGGTAQETIARWQEPMRARAGDEAVDALIAGGSACPMEEIVAVAGNLRVTERAPGEPTPDPPVSLMTALGSIE